METPKQNLDLLLKPIHHIGSFNKKVSNYFSKIAKVDLNLKKPKLNETQVRNLKTSKMESRKTPLLSRHEVVDPRTGQPVSLGVTSQFWKDNIGRVGHSVILVDENSGTRTKLISGKESIEPEIAGERSQSPPSDMQLEQRTICMGIDKAKKFEEFWGSKSTAVSQATSQWIEEAPFEMTFR